MNTVNKWLLAACLIMAGLLVYGGVKSHKDKALAKADKEAAMTAISGIKTDTAAKVAAYQAQINDLAQQKQQVKTVIQIVHDLPKQVVLPDSGKSLTEVTEKQADAANAADPTALPIAPGSLCMSKEDAKALYDAANDGNQCKLQLQAVQVQYNGANEIIAVKDREIKQQEVLLKGGTKWQHIKAAKWPLIIGGLLGAGATAYLTHK